MEIHGVSVFHNFFPSLYRLLCQLPRSPVYDLLVMTTWAKGPDGTLLVTQLLGTTESKHLTNRL